MGACDFYLTRSGKTAREAFHAAVDDARWEHGNGGYTGTIAEKHSFEEIELPKRMTVDKMISAIQNINYKGRIAYRTKNGEVEITNRETRSLLMRAARIFDDKWGPALCIKLTGKALADAKTRMGLKRKRINVYHFCGMASS